MAPPPASAGPLPELRLEGGPGGQRAVALGPWALRELAPRMARLSPQLRRARGGQAWDLRGVTRLDAAGAVLFWEAWGKKRPPELRLNEAHRELFDRLANTPPCPRARRRRDPLRWVAGLGRRLLEFFDHAAGLVALLGQMVLESLHLLRRPRDIPWREISANVYRTGAQALPITALLGFLIGITLSYLTTQQLQAFGADVFIVNILGISIIRELGPMLAAVLVAGRSGSSMTAQLGVMRVTQELDALTVSGISPGLRLVFPKVVALTITLPLLVLWTNAISIVGGALAAQAQLGISMGHFLASLPEAVPYANLWLGVGKAAVFGFLIALIACHFGLRVLPNTESLGAGTTRSVVTAITVVILVDAVFAVLFVDVGI